MPITNKATPNISAEGDTAFANYIAILWQTIVIIGGLAVLFYLAWGALDWILSGSDQERLKRAKNKIQNSLFGLVILTLSYAIIQFISRITGLDILNPVWPTLN